MSYRKLCNYNTNDRCDSESVQCNDKRVLRQCGGPRGLTVCTLESHDWTLQCSGDQTGLCFPGQSVFKCPDGRNICVNPMDDKIKMCNGDDTESPTGMSGM